MVPRDGKIGRRQDRLIGIAEVELQCDIGKYGEEVGVC